MKTITLLILWSLLSVGLTASAQDCETALDLADYITTDSRPFISLSGDQFIEGNRPYVVQGINYYPMQYPWRRFLTETDIAVIHPEFDLMRDTGFNTLRIFLWNQALFQCNGVSSLPVESAFNRLDAIMQLATDYNFRLIVTLNDLPDLPSWRGIYGTKAI